MTTDILTLETKSGQIVSVDPGRDLIVVEGPNGGSSIVIDLSSDQIRISSAGDIELTAGGRLKLHGKQGIQLTTDGEAELKATGDTVIQGEFVRIN